MKLMNCGRNLKRLVFGGESRAHFKVVIDKLIVRVRIFWKFVGVGIVLKKNMLFLLELNAMRLIDLKVILTQILRIIKLIFQYFSSCASLLRMDLRIMA